MPPPPDTGRPALEDVAALAIRGALGRVHVAGPAEVVSYDPATQTATVQPVVRSRYYDPETGAVVTYLPKPIVGVPVVFPAGAAAGGASITWPLGAGDAVTLLCADRSTTEWKITGQADNTPADGRRFDLTDCFALPGGLSPSEPLPSSAYASDALVLRAPTGGVVRLGSATASSPVALGPDVEAYGVALAGQINAFVTAVNAWAILLTAATGVPWVPAAGVTAPTAGQFDAGKVEAE